MVRLKVRTIEAAALALAILVLSGAARAEAQVDYQALIDQKSPALVTVKYMLKMSMSGEQDEQSESETTGVMIDSGGLVLCSNTSIAGPMAIVQKMMMGSMFGGGSEMSLNPTDIKVLIGDDTEGLEATLLTKDTDIDLVWIQIDEPGDGKFPAIDFAQAAIPAIGDRLFAIRALDKYFDRTIVIDESRLGGIIKKPRDLYMPTGGSGAQFGVPIFTAGGEAIGLVILQLPEADFSPGNMMGMMTSMFGMQDGMMGLILPAATIVKATERALASQEEEEE